MIHLCVCVSFVFFFLSHFKNFWIYVFERTRVKIYRLFVARIHDTTVVWNKPCTTCRERTYAQTSKSRAKQNQNELARTHNFELFNFRTTGFFKFTVTFAFDDCSECSKFINTQIRIYTCTCDERTLLVKSPIGKCWSRIRYISFCWLAVSKCVILRNRLADWPLKSIYKYR